MIITSVQGDTWDTLAVRAYGAGQEAKAQILMEARENIRLLDLEIFPAGVSVFAPELPDETPSDDWPEWRR